MTWVQFYIASWPVRSSVTAGKQAHAIGHHWLSNNRDRDWERVSRRQKEKWNDIGGPRAYSLPLGRADMPSNPSWLETVTTAGHTTHTSLFITYNTHASLWELWRAAVAYREAVDGSPSRREILLWISWNILILNTMGLAHERQIEWISNKSFINPFICRLLHWIKCDIYTRMILCMYDLHRN